ncbi:MAG: translation initiation factor IF-3 [Bdellovibrionales bacterium RIFOXYD1_FULL_53_11]|nr:MAG: translation initiation factor IF-3 [Bdellovibrionales bacterium RIFOXYD1_FULL_53_11]
MSGPRPRGPYQPQQQSFSKDEPRVNERIRVPQVLLIDDVGNKLGVVQTGQALQMARDKGLDLMEVAPNAQPPVCKICDFGKYKYEKKKKDHQARKKQVVVKIKEVQLRPQTEQHDLDYKFRNARQFLEDGDKVKVTLMFRGREVAYADQGYKMLKQMVELLKDVALIEAPPKLEGRKMIMVLGPAPKKPGQKSAAPKIP